MSGSVRSGPLLHATRAAYGVASPAGSTARPCEDRYVPPDPPLLRACRGESLDPPPVWFMRQAGRSLPEYRKVRDDVPMLQACSRPEMIVELTLQPVRRYGVDAAILFSDIVVPLRAVGVAIEIEPGIGPVLKQPIRTRADLDVLRALEPADVPFVSDAVRAVATESALPVHVKVSGSERYADEVEAAVYFCCLEALQNAAKHATGARAVAIALRHDDALCFEVRDDVVDERARVRVPLCGVERERAIEHLLEAARQPVLQGAHGRSVAGHRER